jgi:hypothetical protein
LEIEKFMSNFFAITTCTIHPWKFPGMTDENGSQFPVNSVINNGLKY